MGVSLLSWKRKEKLHTDIANMDLRIVFILALLENISVPQFRVNSANHGSTVPCEQRENVDHFCVN